MTPRQRESTLNLMFRAAVLSGTYHGTREDMDKMDDDIVKCFLEFGMQMCKLTYVDVLEMGFV